MFHLKDYCESNYIIMNLCNFLKKLSFILTIYKSVQYILFFVKHKILIQTEVFFIHIIETVINFFSIYIQVVDLNGNYKLYILMNLDVVRQTLN